ncbi:MAG: hypothetical protein IJF53_00320 [Clostridia bacterium]|nr:hypothetical protein [Clostridia bacterium]MBQ3063164.1 hypothetical protein [Clostridia bacterium]MBQ9966257.1 hypothetical protein [Clostridia bacterium]
MDRYDAGDLPDSMLFPMTFSFPIIRDSGLPKEFKGVRNQKALSHWLYDLDFEYSYPLWR